MNEKTLTTVMLLLAFGINQGFSFMGGLKRGRALFWSIQLFNVAAALACIVFGLPGFDSLPMLGPIVGLVFLVHVVMNAQARLDWERGIRNEATMAALQEERQKLDAAAKARRKAKARSGDTADTATMEGGRGRAPQDPDETTDRTGRLRRDVGAEDVTADGPE